VSYSYSRIGEQKCLEQTQQRYGSRISILGLWQPDERFEYALVQGGFKSASYISVIDWVAATANETLKRTGRLTVIVQDNGPIHTSKVVKWFVSSGHGGKRKDYSFSSCLPIAPR
jgi:hypothetical protein